MSRLSTPSGAAVAAVAAAGSISPWPRIWAITTLRRPVAATGCWIGSNWVGLCTIPASRAASGTVSRSAVVSKYVRAAAATP